MNSRRILIFALTFFALPAQAEEMLEDVDLYTFSKTSKLHTDEYMEYRIGDRFEWTLYGADYSKLGYGHRFEWGKNGLSVMSVCMEVDGETGGSRYRNIVDEAHCPKFESAYRWYVPYEGQVSRCLKVDKLTNGGRFSRIVDNARCVKPETIYMWEKKYSTSQAECLEVDGETLGKIFRQPARRSDLCTKTLNVDVAYGRKEPYMPRAAASRSPASIPVQEAKEVPAEFDIEYWEDLDIKPKPVRAPQ